LAVTEHPDEVAYDEHARAGLMGTLVRKKHLFLNASRSCLMGTLSGKKPCDINKWLDPF
jgi:hypothetical protein